MNGVGDGSSDLDRIQGPSDPPPDQPDEKTAAEIRRATAKPPTPTERWALEIERHHSSLENERLRLLDENGKLRSQFDRLGPENAKLRESHGNLIANNLIALGFLTVGSCLISGAGLGWSDIVKFAILFLGIGSTMAGLIVSALANMRGRRNA